MRSDNLSSTNIATIRTAVNALVVGAVIWLVSIITGQSVDTTNPLVIVGVAFVMGFGYRLSRVVTYHFPQVAWLLFGLGEAPRYDQPKSLSAAFMSGRYSPIENQLAVHRARRTAEVTVVLLALFLAVVWLL